MKAFIDAEGTPHRTALLDGGRVEERLLESLYLEVSLSQEGEPVVAFSAEDAGYVSRLNERGLLEDAANVVRRMMRQKDFTGLYADASGEELSEIESVQDVERIPARKSRLP
jgi:hypothetical protein